MTVNETKAKLGGGRHDGREVVVLDVPVLISVSSAGDAEAITFAEAANAVAVGHDLYRHQVGNVLAFYEHVTLHSLLHA